MSLSLRIVALERLAVAEELASVLRHDLRNKLASVRNASFFVRRRLQASDAWNADPRVARFSELIDADVDAALGLLDGRVGRGRFPDPPAATCDVGPALEAALSLVPAAAGRVRLSVPSPARVVAAEEELALLLRLGLENALDACDAGPIEISVAGGAAEVALRIRDAGGGVPEDVLPRVFEPFFTTREGRSGLGLPVAKRLAERRRGSARLLSGDGGATLEVRLPAATEVAGG